MVTRPACGCFLPVGWFEAGARFVTVNFGGWDDHTQIREAYQKRMPAFDNALATLISDLDERGLLDETLVWVASEFGRTPKNQFVSR